MLEGEEQISGSGSIVKYESWTLIWPLWMAANVPIFTIKLFRPFAVNKKGELTTSGDSQPYHGEWKVRNILVLV